MKSEDDPQTFTQQSQCQPPPNCPTGRVVNSREGQPHKEISCLSPSGLEDKSGHSRDTELFCNPSTSTPSARSWAFPHNHSENICEPLKCASSALRLARGFERSQLDHRGCTRGAARGVLSRTEHSPEMLQPDPAKVRQGPRRPATPGAPGPRQLLSTCRHLANRPSFEVQAKLGTLLPGNTWPSVGGRGEWSPSPPPPKFQSWHFFSSSLSAAAVHAGLKGWSTPLSSLKNSTRCLRPRSQCPLYVLLISLDRNEGRM